MEWGARHGFVINFGGRIHWAAQLATEIEECREVRESRGSRVSSLGNYIN